MLPSAFFLPGDLQRRGSEADQHIHLPRVRASASVLACGELMLEQQVLHSASQPASKDKLLPDY